MLKAMIFLTVKSIVLWKYCNEVSILNLLCVLSMTVVETRFSKIIPSVTISILPIAAGWSSIQELLMISSVIIVNPKDFKCKVFMQSIICWIESFEKR